MTELMKRLYDKAGGNIYRVTTTVTVDAWGSAQTIATAPAAGVLWITNIYVMPGATADKLHIGISAEGDEFKGIMSTIVLTGVIDINMSSCPMELKNGAILKANHDAATPGTSYVTVRGYYT